LSHAEKETLRPLTWRNYRPEYPVDHLRKHTIFYPSPTNFGPTEAKMKSTNAAHRLAFLASAALQNALFMDLQQVPDEIPVPEHHLRWGAILNDDEPSRFGSRGPDFFHRPSLIKLVRNAKAIVLNTSGPDGPTYLMASLPLAQRGDNCLLIETTNLHAPAWREFLGQHRGNSPVAIVTGTLERLH
jgi:hypothetical protein